MEYEHVVERIVRQREQMMYIIPIGRKGLYGFACAFKDGSMHEFALGSQAAHDKAWERLKNERVLPLLLGGTLYDPRSLLEVKVTHEEGHRIWLIFRGGKRVFFSYDDRKQMERVYADLCRTLVPLQDERARERTATLRIVYTSH